MPESEVIRMRVQTRPNEAAGAIAGMIRQSKTPVVHAIGAAAVNQALKAVAVARSYLAERDGIAIACIPRLVNAQVDGATRTVMHIAVIVVDTVTAPQE